MIEWEWETLDRGTHATQVAHLGPFKLRRAPNEPHRPAVSVYVSLGSDPDVVAYLDMFRRETFDEAEVVALTWIRETCTATLTALDTEE